MILSTTVLSDNTVCAKKNFPYRSPFIIMVPTKPSFDRCATVVISTVQRSFQRCNGRTQYERCFTENNGGVTILASALSLDQLSSARISASWQRLLPIRANKEGRVLRARDNLRKAGLQGLSQRHVPALAVETRAPLTCKITVALGMTIKRWRRFRTRASRWRRNGLNNARAERLLDGVDRCTTVVRPLFVTTLYTGMESFFGAYCTCT